MKKTLNLALLVCALVVAPVVLAEEPACITASKAVTKTVKASPDNVLAIVQREIAASPDCACEIVKAAIVATEADAALVGQIVVTAIEGAPDKMQIITTCAVAVAADALPEVRAALAKLLASREGWKLGVSAKGGLDAKDAKGGITPPDPEAVRNPLDGPYLVPGLPPIHPELISSTCTPDEFPNIDIIR